MKTHKDLDVWNKAMDFVIFLYKKTKAFQMMNYIV